jgi:hypothetical protein
LQDLIKLAGSSYGTSENLNGTAVSGGVAMRDKNEIGALECALIASLLLWELVKFVAVGVPLLFIGWCFVHLLFFGL